MIHDTTVNPREVAFYENLAAFWWDDTGPFWPLHRLNELRVTYLRDQFCHYFNRTPDAERPLEGLRILDVGCGGGILAESMAKLGQTHPRLLPRRRPHHPDTAPAVQAPVRADLHWTRGGWRERPVGRSQH